MKDKKTMSPSCDQAPLTPEAARQARVKAIKEAVASGTYQIDTETLANSLLSDLLWKEVLRTRRPPDEKV